jgi:hypothetical protein
MRCLSAWGPCLSTEQKSYEGANMTEISFTDVWNNIAANEGAVFYTARGKPFTYRMGNDRLVPIRDGVPVRQSLTRQNFENAFGLLPFNSPGEINSRIRGPAYVYALLHDPRIISGPSPKQG